MSCRTSVSCSELLMECCIYDEIFIAILMKNNKYNYILQSQNIQFLRVDKIGFPKPITFYDGLHTPHTPPQLSTLLVSLS